MKRLPGVRQLKKIKYVRIFDGKQYRLSYQEYDNSTAMRRVELHKNAGHKVRAIAGKDSLGNKIFRIYVRKKK